MVLGLQLTDPERNYHVFYQLCDGATPEEREAWSLGEASSFSYLNHSSCYELPGVNNAEEYKVCPVLCLGQVGCCTVGAAGDEADGEGRGEEERFVAWGGLGRGVSRGE
jgi:hypothetical protein